MWIFSSINNYGEMVDKISHSVFVISTALLFLLSQTSDEFMNALEKLSFGATIEIFDLKIQLATFYFPLFMAMVEHMFKFHDICSTLFGIRKRYDKNVIVEEFLSICKINKEIKHVTDEQVKRIMSSCFYKYASSTNPIIDSHYITLTLTEWCWFWIILDTLILYNFIGVIWLIMSWWKWKNFLLFIAINVILIILLKFIKLTLKKYTKDEISAIISINDEKITGDKKIEKVIKEAIKNALQNR